MIDRKGDPSVNADPVDHRARRHRVTEIGVGYSGVTQARAGDARDAGDSRDAGDAVRLTVVVRGRVQGVGFRWWTRARALELGLVGTATNRPDGQVEVVVEGLRESCQRLLTLLTENPASPPPPGAHRTWFTRPGAVTTARHSWTSARGGLAGFHER
jgi:acylphosphatase